MATTMASGDWNGDGIADLLVASARNNIGPCEEGEPCPDFELRLDHAQLPAWAAYCPGDQPHFGFSIAAAGDVNGDGQPDLVVGAIQAGHVSKLNYTLHGSGFASLHRGHADGATVPAPQLIQPPAPDVSNPGKA